MLVEIATQCLIGKAPLAAHQKAQRQAQGRRQRIQQMRQAIPVGGSEQIAEITLDGGTLQRITLDQPPLVFTRMGWHRKLEIRVHKTFELLRHFLPLQLALGEVVKQLAAHALGHVADVMNPHVELETTTALEGVGLPADSEMLLQHQYPLALLFRQQHRGGQRADAGANHDGVERTLWQIFFHFPSKCNH